MKATPKLSSQDRTDLLGVIAEVEAMRCMLTPYTREFPKHHRLWQRLLSIIEQAYALLYQEEGL